jgi:DNA polymerase I-like protein with 3'-5' exonuclease and polymerase domains
LLRFIKAKDPDATITEEKAKELYDNYFKAYPGVRKFIEKMRAFVEEHGYVENMFGFRRPLNTGASVEGYDNDDEDNEESAGGAYWGNQAINTPIQGAAHQLMLMAIATLYRKKKKYRILGVPTIEVHDFLGFKTKLKNILRAFNLCKELLEIEPLNVVKKDFPDIKWNIPLVVEGEIGLRLGDTVEGEDEKGNLKKMHELLCDMFFESFVKEVKLDAELKAAA